MFEIKYYTIIIFMKTFSIPTIYIYLYINIKRIL